MCCCPKLSRTNMQNNLWNQVADCPMQSTAVHNTDTPLRVRSELGILPCGQRTPSTDSCGKALVLSRTTCSSWRQIACRWQTTYVPRTLSSLQPQWHER